MKPTRFLLILVIALTCSCSRVKPVTRPPSADTEKIAKGYIHQLKAGDIFALVSELDPTINRGEAVQQLTTLGTLLPNGQPTSTTLVSYQAIRAPNKVSTIDLVYQLGFGSDLESKWYLVDVAWREFPDHSRQLTGMHVSLLLKSQQEINAFNFKHALLRHYVVAAFAILVPLFILTSFVVCLRTKMCRLKWLWLIIIPFGFVRFSFNWTTGSLLITPLAYQVLGTWVTRSGPVGAWLIYVTLPVGAIAFWLVRKRLMEPAAQSLPPTAPEE